MKTFIENPYNNGKPIFLLFDSTHLFKNFYNNFRNKRYLFCPEYPPYGPQKANFDHVVKVYELELGKPVKFAQKLNDQCLNPAAIEKCNVSLAVSVFHESTINALDQYSNQFPEFGTT